MKQGRSDSELCFLCEEALQFLKTYVDNNATEVRSTYQIVYICTCRWWLYTMNIQALGMWLVNLLMCEYMWQSWIEV